MEMISKILILIKRVVRLATIEHDCLVKINRRSLSLPIKCFPELGKKHLQKVPGTLELERMGSELVKKSFTDIDEVENFIREVCKWGGYPGIAGRVMKNNKYDYLKSQFLRAYEKIECDKPELALLEINNIKNLGTPSFASKHLRFLSPEKCPILDSIIQKNIGIPDDYMGYKILADEYTQISKYLAERNIVPAINRPNNKWFVADVDMVLFSFINEWCSCNDAICKRPQN